MANFSVNQSRQMYVMKSNSEYQASTISNVGDIQFKAVDNGLNKEGYFLYKGADGNIMKSDFIPKQNLSSAEVIAAADMNLKMRKISISLPSGINSGNAVTGQNYILNINFKNFFSSGDDSQYYKSTAVLVTSANTTASAFYKSMVKALNKAFSREDGATATSNPYLKFAIGTSSASAVIQETDSGWGAATATRIIIEEKPQDWQLGTKQARRIYFDVFPEYINDGSDDVIWAKYESTTDNYYLEETPLTIVNNGQNIADLEWFCMGERGDQYRGMGYPNVIHTEYLVNPANAYHVLELHFAFTDTGVNSYRTEKEITIVTPTQAEMIKLVKDIQTKFGITVAKSTTAATWTWT